MRLLMTALVSLLFSTTLLAGKQTVYTCTLDDDFDDWVLTIVFPEGPVGDSFVEFFDNDTTDTLRFKDYRSLETFPPQQVFTFVSYVGRSLVVRNKVSFNKTKLRATLGGSPKSDPIAFSCTLEK